MAERSCVHCYEEIPESAQVCPRCGTWEPFAPSSSGDAADVARIDLTSDQEAQQTAQQTSKGGLGGFLKDVALQYAIGCGGFLAVIVVAIVVVVVVSSCGGGASGYDQLECQDYYDDLIDEIEFPEPSDVQILKITASKEVDRIAWNKRLCPGVVETTEGNFRIWTFVTEETSTEWFFESAFELMENQPVPLSAPAPQQ